MADSRKLTRRQVLKGTAAAGALGLLGGLDWVGQAWGAPELRQPRFLSELGVLSVYVMKPYALLNCEM